MLEALRLWELWWHDLLLVSSGAASGYALAEDERPVSSAGLCPGSVARFLDDLCEIRDMTQRNANVRLALSVLVLRMPHQPQALGR